MPYFFFSIKTLSVFPHTAPSPATDDLCLLSRLQEEGQPQGAFLWLWEKVREKRPGDEVGGRENVFIEKAKKDISEQC